MSKGPCYYEGKSFEITIDICLACLFLVMVITEIIVVSHSKLPSSATFLGLKLMVFQIIHWYASCAFFIILIIHVIYHWEWFSCLGASIFTRKRRYRSSEFDKHRFLVKKEKKSVVKVKGSSDKPYSKKK